MSFYLTSNLFTKILAFHYIKCSTVIILECLKFLSNFSSFLLSIPFYKIFIPHGIKICHNWILVSFLIKYIDITYKNGVSNIQDINKFYFMHNLEKIVFIAHIA